MAPAEISWTECPYLWLDFHSLALGIAEGTARMSRHPTRLRNRPDAAAAW